MHHLKQRRVHDQDLRLADELGEDLSRRRGSKKRLSFLTPVERGEWCSPATPGGNRCEKNLSASRKKERSLCTPRSCCAGTGRGRDDLRVRKPLYGLVASSMGVEQRVGVVYEAEEDVHRFFSRWTSGGVCWGRAIRGSFRRGFGWPPLYRQSTQHTHLGSRKVNVSALAGEAHLRAKTFSAILHAFG